MELIDTLRCPGQHEDSWLVAAVTHSVDRHILEGTLGCPVCGAEFEVRAGEVWMPFGEPAGMRPAVDDDPAEVTRLAALLGLDERGGLYVLCGTWTAMAPALLELAPARLLAVSPTSALPGMSVLRGTGDALPIAGGAARGVALDRPSGALAEAAVRVLVPGGRLVAPATTAVPALVSILARDGRHWVAERDPAASISAPVRLGRARLP